MSMKVVYCFLAILYNVTAESYKSSLTFVIDDTYSMSDDIAQVITGANAIFDTVLNHNASQIENFILVTFNDYGEYNPGVNLRASTKDRNEFRAELQAIEVNGGGDCPEYSMAGIQKGLEESLPASYVYVFTDATAKDYSKFEEVKSFALKKLCQIVFVLTGDCNSPASSPDYKVYYDLAKATSGEVFNLKKQEVGKILEYVKNTIKGRRILLADGTFPPGEHSLNLVTDTKMKDPTLSITSVDAVKPSVDITASDGTKPSKNVIIETDKNVVYGVNMIVPGEHTIKVESPSVTRVKVTARSDIDFRHGFSTFKPSSLNETSTKPVPGVKSHLAVKLIEGDIKLKTVKILDMSDNIIQELPLELKYDTSKFYTTEAFDPPNTMFQIEITGYDPESKTNITRKALTPIEPQKVISGMKIEPKPPTVVIKADAKIHTEFDEKLQLVCEVNGYPKPDIVWINKEKEVTLSGTIYEKELPYDYTNILIIDKVNENATYECKASNPSGSDTKFVKVDTERKEYFNVLEPQHKKLNIEYGKEGKFQCLVDAYPPAEITWYKNGRELVAGDNINIYSNKSIVTIQNTTLSDKGVYMCEARNKKSRKVLFREIAVVGVERPVIEKVRANINVKIGLPVKIDCKILKGKPKPLIRWFYTPSVASDKLVHLPQFDNNESLKIPSASKSYSGMYQCRADNEISRDFHEVTLTVEYPPEIEQGVDFVKAKVDSEISINCIADGGPTPYVTWLKDGVQISNKGNIQIFGNRNKVTLRLTPEDISDTGNYTCKATNRLGTAVRNVNVDVSDPVTITPPKKSNLDVLVGSKLSLPCEAHGVPKPDIKWVYSSLTERSPYMKTIRIEGEPLNLERIQANEEGYYTCIASNAGGAANITYIVNVFDPPIIKNTYVNKYFVALEGDRALRITCTASGNPKPDITWKKDGQNLALGSTYYMEESTLIIRDVPNDARGFYTCEARNSVGIDREVYEVSVEKYPPPSRIASSILIKEGNTVHIKCDVPHTKIDQLRWYKDGVLVRNGELVLTNSSMRDGGQYTCRVGDFFKSVSKDVRIDVGRKPEFTSVEDENIEMVEGPAILTCDASSYPIPSVTWYLDGTRVNITETNWYFPEGIRIPGQYRCEVKNALGSISRTYNVVPRDCFINTQKLTNLQPLMLSSNLTWPLYERTNDYIILLKGEQFILFCPKGFKSFSIQYITAFCDGGMKVKVNGNTYDYESIECNEEVVHEVYKTGEKCMPGPRKTEKLKIGYKVLKAEPIVVYEICLDKTNNVPLYAMHSMPNNLADDDGSAKWSDSKHFKIDFGSVYNCSIQTSTVSTWLGNSFHMDDGCCFSQRQLVSSKDVVLGVAQKATFSYFNVVPHWGTCNSANWDDIEERVRHFAKRSYLELLIWTGTANVLNMPSVYSGTTNTFFTDIRGYGQPVPLFLWKVVQDPESKSSIAIIQVNVPDLKPSEVSQYILCGDSLGLSCGAEWMNSSKWHDLNRGYTYCCSLPDFVKAFGLSGVFNPGMNKVLTSDPSFLPEEYSLAII